jgi:hypothetical protein
MKEEIIILMPLFQRSLSDEMKIRERSRKFLQPVSIVAMFGKILEGLNFIHSKVSWCLGIYEFIRVWHIGI